MAGLTVYGQQAVLNHLVGKQAWAMPTLYVALTSTQPTDSAAGVEATYTGYARKVTAASDWNSATNAIPSVSNNASTITFNQCTAGSTPNNLGYWEGWDAASGGNRIIWGALTAPLAVTAGISPSFAPGQLFVSAD